MARKSAAAALAVSPPLQPVQIFEVLRETREFASVATLLARFAEDSWVADRLFAVNQRLESALAGAQDLEEARLADRTAFTRVATDVALAADEVKRAIAVAEPARVPSRPALRRASRPRRARQSTP